MRNILRAGKPKLQPKVSTVMHAWVYIKVIYPCKVMGILRFYQEENQKSSQILHTEPLKGLVAFFGTPL